MIFARLLLRKNVSRPQVEVLFGNDDDDDLGEVTKAAGHQTKEAVRLGRAPPREQPEKRKKRRLPPTGPDGGVSSDSYRGASIPPPFRLESETLLVARFFVFDDDDDRSSRRERERATKIAGFDFDDTLAVNDFRDDRHDAVYAHARDVFEHLHRRGFALAVLTNESLDHLKHPDAVARRLHRKCRRLKAWLAPLEARRVPVLVCVALSKQCPRGFHKSRGDGMWRRAERALGPGGTVDRALSFFVGDSDDDRKLAASARLRFYDVHHFFKHRHPAHTTAAEAASS